MRKASKGTRAPAADLQSRAQGTQVVGVLRVHRNGFGFVEPLSGKGEDVYLARREAQRALDGDLVRVALQPGRGRTEGRLLNVLERRRQSAVGTYFERGKNSFVISRDPALRAPIRVPPTQLAKHGDLVKVRIAPRQAGGASLFGEVAGSVGKPGDTSAEVLSIAFAEGFNDEFPPQAMDEASKIPLRVPREQILAEADPNHPERRSATTDRSRGAPERTGRKDLRELPLVTIDGEDARDFDDAVYCEPKGDGWRLLVAIADVSHYVGEGTALDAEAYRRATSVYLPNRVLPMLPERLSNGICSLVPNEDRLCLVADMFLDQAGQLRSSELYPAAMRSAARCTYEQVQAVLDGRGSPERHAFREHFLHLQKLARALTRMRELRGAIDFDLPERKVVLDERGNPIAIQRRERKESHRIIEECMLAANEAVAGYFRRRRLPTIYRYHGEPDEEKLAAFAALANAHGFRLPKKGKISSRDLNLFLEKLEDHPEQRALNQLLLRSMMQAVYTAESVGHYGLAAEHYLHFTSPIRRYPDLMVHRLLRASWSGQDRASAKSPQLTAEKLEEIALHCSERERAAMEVERRVIAYYSVLLVKDRVGEEFSGTVSALTDFGFFVELDDPWIEGLVKGETLGRFRFEKEAHVISYSSGLKVRVGQRARVRLISTNLQRRQLDFELLELEGRHRKRAGRAPSVPDDLHRA